MSCTVHLSIESVSLKNLCLSIANITLIKAGTDNKNICSKKLYLKLFSLIWNEIDDKRNANINIYQRNENGNCCWTKKRWKIKTSWKNWIKCNHISSCNHYLRANSDTKVQPYNWHQLVLTFQSKPAKLFFLFLFKSIKLEENERKTQKKLKE